MDAILGTLNKMKSHSPVFRWIATAALVSTVGCATVRETYYLKAQSFEVNESNNTRTPIGIPNFYRVAIRARSLFSTSQYAAGWYQTAAVNGLFGELKGDGKKVSVDGVTLDGFVPRAAGSVDLRPLTAIAEGANEAAENPGPATSTAGDSAAPSKGSSNQVTTVETSFTGLDSAGASQGEGETFVIFHSSNADALVNQIRTFISREAVEDDIIQLVTGKDRRAAESAEHLHRLAVAREPALVAALDGFTARLEAFGANNPAAADVPKLEAEIAALFRLVVNEGKTVDDLVSVSTREEAREWLQSHPTAFAATGGAR